jgi:hypothetical protein
MYAKEATGEFQFRLVYRLLECFGYKPDPKRQTQTKDRPRGGYHPHDDSLERNYRNFVQAHPMFCSQLNADLKLGHEGEGDRRFAEYDKWVGEKGLAPAVFEELRLNPFKWDDVFSPPRPSQDAHPGVAIPVRPAPRKAVAAGVTPRKKMSELFSSGRNQPR